MADRFGDLLSPRAGPRLTTYAIGFSVWKHAWLRRYFPGRRFIFLSPGRQHGAFDADLRARVANGSDCEFFVWGAEPPRGVEELARLGGIPIRFVEDGFVRSTRLGASHAWPLSLCVDSRAAYFHAGRASDLETLLCEHDFDADPALLQRADMAMRQLLDAGISKYNNAPLVDPGTLYGPKTTMRVLVLGQVEDDASIRHGCDRPLDNNDVVRLAAAENPTAQIIYKPHPDVINGHRPARSQPQAVRHLCDLLTDDVPLAQALESIDHVYTISSLGGFEALQRGIRVTTLGCPFYSGWGLTDDRQPNLRRQRRLGLRELFAASYLLYPRYFDASNGAPSSFEEVVQTLHSARAAPPKPASSRTLLPARVMAAARTAATGLRGLLQPTFPSRSGSAAPGRNPLSLYVP